MTILMLPAVRTIVNPSPDGWSKYSQHGEGEDIYDSSLSYPVIEQLDVNLEWKCKRS